MEEDYTYFGFKKIDPKEKVKLVGEVFSDVAKNYDLMNNLMSMGVHHIWKKKFVAKLTNTMGSLIDVAGGTGDITKAYWQKSRKNNHTPKIVMTDINYEMLFEGRNNLINNNIIDGVDYACSDAENLPFEDMSFDYYTISFGIRNVTNIDKVLSEAYRVLKPGGKFLCLEFSKPENEMLSKCYDFYSFNVIPFIGKVIAKNEDAYQYLIESIRKFPSQEEFKNMIDEAGFKMSAYENLTGGIVAIHSGVRV